MQNPEEEEQIEGQEDVEKALDSIREATEAVRGSEAFRASETMRGAIIGHLNHATGLLERKQHEMNLGLSDLIILKCSFDSLLNFYGFVYPVYLLD